MLSVDELRQPKIFPSPSPCYTCVPRKIPSVGDFVGEDVGAAVRTQEPTGVGPDHEMVPE